MKTLHLTELQPYDYQFKTKNITIDITNPLYAYGVDCNIWVCVIVYNNEVVKRGRFLEKKEAITYAQNWINENSNKLN